MLCVQGLALAAVLVFHVPDGSKATHEGPKRTRPKLAKFTFTADHHTTEKANLIPQTRIIKGSVVPAGKYPFFVIVRCSVSKYTSDCGGSLITNQWVVTAAHCLLPQSPPAGLSAFSPCDAVQVLPGVVAYNKRGVNQWLSTDRQIKHPTYSPRSYQGRWYDIGLLRLETPVTTNAHVSVIPLPMERDSLKDTTDDGLSLTVMGIGETLEPLPNADVHELKEGNMTFITSTKCRAMNASSVEGVNFCMITKSRGDRFCSGDSGGPIVGDPANSGKLALVGVIIKGPASSGGPCVENKPYYGVRVYHFLEWIKSFVEDEYTNQEECSCDCPSCDLSCYVH